MLVNLSVRNFVIVKKLDIDFKQGMTAVTGETGAGKSIAIDALGLCLGNRAEAAMVRTGESKAEIIATFGIKEKSLAARWLNDNDFGIEDGQCLVRRIITDEGRSRAYINGTPVPLQQLRELGAKLVTIHGQHAQQGLLKPENQRRLLDSKPVIQTQLSKVAELSKNYQQIQKQIQQLSAEQQQREDRKTLLSYQLAELDEFALDEDEFEKLEAEFKKLSHGQSILEESQYAYHFLWEANDANVNDLLQLAHGKLEALVDHDPQLQPVVQMLSEAQINISEASAELRDYLDQLEMDPIRMQQIEARYNKANELARKHTVRPEALYQHQQELQQELHGLDSASNTLEELGLQLDAVLQEYKVAADCLHQLRQKQASWLEKQVTCEIKKMNMPDAIFEIRIDDSQRHIVSGKGHDIVEFYLCSNKGMHMDKLEKAASGGELSRIGLALHVLGNSNHAVPTLIFDEVDTGISGPTASVVGQLLRTLGSTEAQVLCVTHLPQVAAKGHNQMLVTKFTDGDTTSTLMQPLDEKNRVEEIARLLAGDTLTDSAINNAKALLEH
ncbi:MAG: DNA repair protein RecN [Aestuariibacter sp.]